MKWLVVAMLLLSAFAFGPDGYCNYSAGESCMNSPDCSSCNVSAVNTLRYFDTYALLSVRMYNYEPAEVPLIMQVRRDDNVHTAKSVDLMPGEQRLLDVRLEREAKNVTLTIELRDRDIGTAWDHETMTLLGLESTMRFEWVIPAVSVLAFMGILVVGLKQIRKGKAPYFIQPIVMPARPPEPPPDEEIIIVPKKKKYYYRK